jgi:ubiquinone/menaquinone biosynthesis C-methylase UbiE
MMGFFRKTDPYEFPSAMAGVKMGNRLLVLGCGDPRLIAALASKVGLTGRACAVDARSERTIDAARVVEREGALVETATASYEKLPYEDAAFDLAVLHDLISDMVPERRVHTLQEVHRVLRPGGRCLVVEPSARGGLGALVARRSVNEHYAASGGAVKALQAEGFAAARTLADREGLLFVEGVKKNV